MSEILEWDAVKDPDEEKDYAVEWYKLLNPAGDKIYSSSFSVSSGTGLNIEAQVFNDQTHRTVVWVSGGTVGTYRLTNTITTTGGRTYEQTIKLKVKNK